MILIPGPSCESRLLFEDDVVYYAGQYLALVVADTLEQAKAAAALVEVRYEEQTPKIETADALDTIVDAEKAFGPTQYARGDVEKAIRRSEWRIQQTYTTPTEHHNTMEPSATVAVWNGDDLTLYDATQWVMGARYCIADMLGMDRDRVPSSRKLSAEDSAAKVSPGLIRRSPRSPRKKWGGLSKWRSAGSRCSPDAAIARKPNRSSRSRRARQANSMRSGTRSSRKHRRSKITRNSAES